MMYKKARRWFYAVRVLALTVRVPALAIGSAARAARDVLRAWRLFLSLSPAWQRAAVLILEHDLAQESAQ